MPAPVRSDLWDRLQPLLGDAYRLERELLAGGMSRLFLATDLSLGRPVVVKVLPPDLAGDVSAARFQREVALSAQFQHPHILPILSAGANDTLLYFVMPFVDGESLQERMRRDGQLPVRETARYLAEIADALSYAHARGVIHRDVKPANILIAGDHAVLVDFGVAQAVVEAALDLRITKTGHFVGTTQYMAPEQLAAVPDIDGRADVFALGVVAYEALAGHLPFAGDTPHQSMSARASQTPAPLVELRPEVPRGLSELVASALVFDPDARLATAAALRDGFEGALTRRSHRVTPVRAVALAGLALAATVAAVLLWREDHSPDVDDDRIAIAPFEVLQPSQALWREGFVDVLSASLDGAGPLRTVPPSVVMRQWAGRPDIESSVAFGRRTGARFVVLGRVMGAGKDSTRVAAWLIDVVTGRRAEPLEVRDATGRMDRIADSLTLALLRDIGTIRPVSAVRRASIGSTSLPALRAFLEGEQHFRRTAWDSARVAYARALALDSTFALAHAHMGLTYAWQRFGTDSVARVHALRAGALNRGLAPRESLLIVADSLRSVAYAYGGDPRYHRHVSRLFATLREATRTYEQDAEAWYRLADAYFHFGIGPRLSVSEREILRTFDTALALDSAFAPAYIHPVELGFAIGDSARALRYVRRYFALRPTDVSAAGTRLAAQLLARGGRDTARARTTLDTASADLLFQAYSAARRALGPNGSAIRLLRLMAEGRRADYAPLADPAFARHRLVLQLSFRGRLHEAAGFPEARRSGVFAEMALAGGIPATTAQPVFAEWLRTDPREPGFGTPLLASAGAWWAQIRDTVSLIEMGRLARRVQPGSEAAEPVRRYSAAAADAYLALARSDTVGALRLLAGLPDSLCQLCAVPRLVHARVLAARGRLREASAILNDRPSLLPSTVDVLWAFERARVLERLGDRVGARAGYAMVLNGWSEADDALLPVVDAARQGLRP